MNPETLNERQALAFGTTTTLSGSALSSGAINMGTGPTRLVAFLLTGTRTGSASITFTLQSSATLSGSYVNITQAGTINLTTPPTLTATTGAALYKLEISSDLLPAGQPFVKATATETASANFVTTIIVVAEDSRYKPGNAFNNATVTTSVVAFV